MRLDADAFGRLSEGIARYFGTARFLIIQTVIVAAWTNVVFTFGRKSAAKCGAAFATTACCGMTNGSLARSRSVRIAAGIAERRRIACSSRMRADTGGEV